MSLRVAINGFGRIGRMVYRRAIETGAFDVVAVNGTADVGTLTHLLKYDSIHGIWGVPIVLKEGGFCAKDQFTQVFSTRNPRELSWGELGIDVVIEATGAFRTRETAGVHLEQGARSVVITAPAKKEDDADLTVVMGVNEHLYNPAVHQIISAASCTTNCLAPVVRALHERFGVEQGMVTTVHSYTNDQKNLDNPHKDLRRARACSESMIPTTTGAAKAIGLVMPDLRGRMNGVSIRVPTPNVSIVDLVAELKQSVTVEQVNRLFEEAADTGLRGVLGITYEPLVSIDFNGDSRSAIVDGLSTMVLRDKTVKVLAWYDNEWGYSCRVVDLTTHMGTCMEEEEMLSGSSQETDRDYQTSLAAQ